MTVALQYAVFSCLLDRSTLPSSGILDLDSYLLRPHILVSMDGSIGEVDNLLRAQGSGSESAHSGQRAPLAHGAKHDQPCRPYPDGGHADPG